MTLRSALLVVLGLAVASLSGCTWRRPPTHPPALRGEVVSVTLEPGLEGDGEKGSIKVIFRGKTMPKTWWWVDTAVKPEDSELLHPVQCPPALVADFSSGEHILQFFNYRPALSPEPVKITVKTNLTTVVEVEYRWRQ